ncbi:hypothetical protein EJ03DRAFT_307020 [Teratosphaeria nubilosa]|uniref:Vacuolar protein sorting-associated protein 62 n=1 Tax=Teratosphaeria nubilosa TaxID=161662 RepID=A0A6G1LJ69_9PEZI|nr:hypothetical protein EJ03DRAFT_307020 [Teratosphaeria nubilosa]
MGWRRWFFGFCTVALVYIIISGFGLKIDGDSTPLETLENAEWVNTSKYWIDRQLCRWLGLCGVMHLNSRGWTWTNVNDDNPEKLPPFSDFWRSGDEDSDSWSDEERQLRYIPQYVLDHAPYVHLFSGEEFWPSDVAEHLIHISPTLNYSIIEEMENDRNLSNLHDLDALAEGRHGRFVYLQSDDNVEEWPNWLTSRHNIPVMPDSQNHAHLEAPWPELDQTEFPDQAWFGSCCSMHGWCGKTEEYCGGYCDPLHGTCFDPLHPPPGPKPDLKRHKRDFSAPYGTRKSNLGRSNAPAILIVADKGDGIVDAFWFFFYSFNLGQKVFNIRFGNHVGDWEHTMIRFKDGKPQSVFLSEHDFGDAYSWHAIEKYLPNPDGSETMLGTWSNRTAVKAAKRPVVYSAVGSHAMYATPGLHPYVLPFGLLHDQTDRGPIWDPTLNLQSYTYERVNKTLRSSVINPYSPTSWLNYAGHWGDKYYPLSDPRQYRFAGQYHYVNGPTGPKFKRLGREQICQGHGTCHIRKWLGGDHAVRELPPEEGEEDGGLPGGNSTDDKP